MKLNVSKYELMRVSKWVDGDVLEKPHGDDTALQGDITDNAGYFGL